MGKISIINKLQLRLLIGLLAILLLACNQDAIIARDRTQSQAVELVALLNRFGITAKTEPVRANKGRYEVTVPERYQNQATALMHQGGLAKDSEMSMQDLLNSGGFLPSPRAVEMFKLDLALASLVEQALKNISAVSSAKVIIRQNSSKVENEPSGSVVILTRANQIVSEDQVRSVVKTALPEIKDENLVVLISETSTESNQLTVQGVSNKNDTVITVPLSEFLYWQVPEGEFKGLAWTFIGSIILTAFVFGALGYFTGYFKFAKSNLNTASNEAGLIGLTGTNNDQKKLTENKI